MALQRAARRFGKGLKGNTVENSEALSLLKELYVYIFGPGVQPVSGLNPDDLADCIQAAYDEIEEERDSLELELDKYQDARDEADFYGMPESNEMFDLLNELGLNASIKHYSCAEIREIRDAISRIGMGA